jgi:N-acetylglucosaminyl-diphospho-decaprenol L-rhamnosyltransferase
MARIAALVVAYYSADEVEGMAASVAAGASTQHTVDVHVIDNSGDPDEIARFTSMKNIASFLPSGKNVGYGGGMNAIAAHVGDGYDWLLVCNPDIRFEPGSIDALIASADSHPTAALFGPRIVGSDGAVYPSARAFPSIRTGIGHALFAGVWPTNPWTRKYHRSSSGATTTDTDVDWVSGACILARPEAFSFIGGFDEEYFMYFEDVDLAWRLAKHGWSTLYVPSARITHSGAHSTRTQADFMRKVHHKSAERYLNNKYRGWYLAPLRVGLRVGLAIRRDFRRG